MIQKMIMQFFKGARGYFFAGIACFALVGLALFIQVQYKLEPCPLCISQRMLLMGLGLLFLVSAILPSNVLRHKILSVLQVLMALAGAGVAIRHWYLQVHKDSIIADCGVGFDYMFDNFPLQKALTLIFRGTGDCAAIDWTFLGLTIPQMSLMAFLMFACFAMAKALRKI